MAEMKINLTTDKVTGKKNIVVALKSDEGATAMEHEADHKGLLKKLLGAGILDPDDLGEIIVERESSGSSLEVPGGMQEQDRRQSQSA